MEEKNYLEEQEEKREIHFYPLEIGEKVLVPCNKINGTPSYIYGIVKGLPEEENGDVEVETELGDYAIERCWILKLNRMVGLWS